ncbi:hypothetical protein ABZ070_10335 [Streptomyces sp. NPDC006283]|uniref:hypothetical protein n=1 Tax=Streptomyces sp. NPDC006283 TaxID=3156741 RepID=UPI0033A6BDAE
MTIPALEALFARQESLAPQSRAHTYTYLFCDLKTDVLLAELPLSGVQYGTVLNGIGVMRAHVPYADETLPLGPDAATVPGRTAVYVDRDGVIVWAGILWTRTPNGSGWDIACAEFLSYYEHRYIKTTLSTEPDQITDTDHVPDGQMLYANQKHMVWSLFNYCHAQPYGNPGISTALLATAAEGPNRLMTYRGYERPEVYRAVYELSQAEDGFDFGVEVGWTASTNNNPPTRYKRHRMWYPRRGRTAAESGLVFAHGGPASSIVSYDWPEAGTQLATETSGIGEGEGEATIVRTAQATDMLESGWLLLEAVSKFEGVYDATRLQSLTNADLAARSQATTQPRFVVEADADPPFGSYSVGDEGLFVIDPSTRMPSGKEQVLRIIAIDAAPATGAERVALTCAAV